MFESEEHKAQMLEAGRLLFSRPCTFEIGAPKEEVLPADGLMEIAFAGRSNVGKSSLINAVTGQNGLARTSNTPGRTQQVNFFNLDDALYVVDLPGYGYAKASKKDIKIWNRLIDSYLLGRTMLRRVFLLVDSRHGVKDNDRKVMEQLDKSAVSYQVVLTKSDKIQRPEQEKCHRQVMEELAKHPAAYPEIILTSSDKGWGIAEIRAEIAALLENS